MARKLERMKGNPIILHNLFGKDILRGLQNGFHHTRNLLRGLQKQFHHTRWYTSASTGVRHLARDRKQLFFTQSIRSEIPNAYYKNGIG